MPSDHAIAAQADPQLQQQFLISAGKLSELVAAAGIRPEDDVLEVGAGIGTVARALPKSRSLTVVELDDRLIGFLRQNVPHARRRALRTANGLPGAHACAVSSAVITVSLVLAARISWSSCLGGGMPSPSHASRTVLVRMARSFAVAWRMHRSWPVTSRAA